METMAFTIPRSISSVTISPCFATVMATGEGHHDKSVFVERHGFEDVGGLAQLATGEGGLGHCAHQAVDRMDLAQVEGLERNQAVFDGIVQMAVFALTAWRISLPLARMILRVCRDCCASTRASKPNAILPDKILYRKQVKGRHDTNPQLG